MPGKTIIHTRIERGLLPSRHLPSLDFRHTVEPRQAVSGSHPRSAAGRGNCPLRFTPQVSCLSRLQIVHLANTRPPFATCYLPLCNFTIATRNAAMHSPPRRIRHCYPTSNVPICFSSLEEPLALLPDDVVLRRLWSWGGVTRHLTQGALVRIESCSNWIGRLGPKLPPFRDVLSYARFDLCSPITRPFANRQW